MTTYKKHYVTFQSPGTMFNEQSTKPIERWDPELAVAMAEHITERYNATPYAFYFSTQIEHAPIPDGEGGQFEVCPKQKETSHRYFLGGEVSTLAQVKERADPKKDIMLSNMECNGWLAVIAVTTKSGFLATQPFVNDDVIIDKNGAVIERASDYKED